MSASSSAASTAVSRSRTAVLAVAAVACALGTYYLWSTVNARGSEPTSSTGLHRSNAIHRRRRRTATVSNDGRTNPAAELPIFIDDVRNDEEDQVIARTLTDGETVVDDQGFQEEFGWNNLPETYQRNGQNIVQLLFRVSEDATRRNAYVHRGCGCNSCGVVPIRGIRYHCANCADFDLCEGCESQGLHIKTHIFYKIRVPAPSFGPKHIQGVPYTGDPDSIMRILPKEITTKLSRETGFERPELDAYWEQWTFMANTDWRDDPDDIGLAMDRKTFERCLVPSGGYRQSAPSLILDRMFAFYDTNKDDLIGFPEFLHGIAYRKKKDKWTKIFAGYDIDGDGYVDRKDFLRMFRSYYTLLRQMHQDMLEGMEEQQMSSTDAHRLVSSRQPLSSAFGQDGRYPRAPDIRAGEGKIRRSNGDLDINDGKGVITESGNDTGNREDVFRRSTPHIVRPERSSTYWRAILDPPQTMDQVPDVLRSLTRVRGAVQQILDEAAEGGSGPHTVFSVPQETEVEVEDEYSSDDYGEGSVSGVGNGDDSWLPASVTVTDEDAEAVEGPGRRVADIRRARRRAAISHAAWRESVQREAYDRWKRRHFYTDEEEGAVPPPDWKEDDDILVQAGLAGESSKSASRPSLHSRSSSRVRFAEDMDDFDTRSNLSTSTRTSRSVPERWGGMDIPDAEKDAGKEVLYQTTQQAYNELLDPLFKEKEDRAVKVAEKKGDCEKYRDLYSTPEFEEWARETEASEETRKKEESRPPPSHPMVRPSWSFSESDIPPLPEVEVDEVRQRPLEDLLAATGYQIQEPDDLDEPADQTGEEQDLNQDAAGSSSRPPVPEIPQQNSPTDDALSIIAQYEHDRVDRTPAQPTTPASSSDSLSSTNFRDPTLPQFRPNSLDTSEIVTSPSQTSSHEKQPQSTIDSDQSTHVIPPSRNFLFQLWKYDKWTKEAEKQGGWGRLNFDQFETKVKKQIKLGKINQMDYLGTWIDFSIP